MNDTPLHYRTRSRRLPSRGARPFGHKVTSNRVVSIHYSLELKDGSVVESTRGSRPFSYLHGAGGIVAGLERELEGRSVGDQIQAVVPPELGYGPFNPNLVKRMPREDHALDGELEPGRRVGAELDDGTVVPVWLVAVDEEELTISFNHPLAGQTLHFSVEVMGVRPARDSEVGHRHAHGEHSGRRDK